MTLSELKTRRDALIARDLEIVAILAEAKRKWVVEKIDGDMTERVTLEAERARLAIEKHELTHAINATKTATAAYRNTLAHAILIKLVTDAGLSELVIKADRAAVDLGASRVAA